MDRLAPIVRFKAAREDAAARQLGLAQQAKREQEAVVEAARLQLEGARPEFDNAALASLVDLAESRGRAALSTAVEQLAVVERIVADVRDSHRRASMERQVLERLRARRLEEAESEQARAERRSFDAIAARRHR